MRKQYLLAIAAALLPLLLAEAGLRAFDAVRGGSFGARTAWFWAYTQDRFLGYRARPDVDLVFAGTDNHIDTNSDGFRDREFDPQQMQGKRLIFCVGESSTWGTGSTNRETTWPRRLEELLRERDPRFLVLNAGIPGYTTIENLQLINLRLLKYKPEAILYMGFRNDVEYYATRLTDEVDLNFYPRPVASIPSSWFERLWMHSALVGVALTRFGSVLGLDNQGKTIPAAGEHLTPRGDHTLRDQIAMMKALTSRHGTQLLWIDQPVDYAQSQKSELLEEARKSVNEELRANAIPLLQAHAIYPHDKEPMLDDVHFTDTGNRLLAELLAPQVTAALGEH